MRERLVDAVKTGLPLDFGFESGQEVEADALRSVLIDRRGEHDPRGLHIKGAKLIGRLDLRRVTSDIALTFDECVLPYGIDISDAELPSVTLRQCLVDHPDEPAVAAARVKTAVVSVVCSVITANCPMAAIDLCEADIGTLDCRQANLANSLGPSLRAESVSIAHDAWLTGGFKAVGGILLTGAEISGQLDLCQAHIYNDSGPAIQASWLKVQRSMILIDAQIHGAVRLLGAYVGGLLDLSGAQIRSGSYVALAADRLHVGEELRLRKGFTAVGGGDTVVSLRDVRVDARLELDPDGITHTSSGRPQIALNGLTYSGIPEGAGLDRWLTMLRHETNRYAVQPYQQLADAHRRAGHDSDVRRILIRQRADQIHRRAVRGRSERFWIQLTGLLLGYGYQPWRALLLVLATVLTAVALTLTLGPNGGLRPGGCTLLQRVGVGIDYAVPLVKTGMREQCSTTDTPTGQALIISLWFLQLLGWSAATLFVAGFTSAVRKT